MTLEEFTLQVKADELWLDMIRNASRGKSLPDAIAKVYGQSVSDGTLKVKPIGEHRKHIFNTLGTQPFSKTVGVQTHQTEEKPPEKLEVKVYATDEQREYWLNVMKEQVKNIQVKVIPPMSHKEIAEQGDWLPKKRRVPTDPLYIHEHFKKVHECRIKVVRDRHPELNDEEIEQYIRKNYPD